MEPLTLTELERFELLHHVRSEHLERLQTHAELRELSEGDVLLTAGQPNSTVYLVRKGSFGVHLEDPATRPVAIIGRGQSIGELSALDHKQTSAYVIAREASIVLAIPEDEIWTLLERSHSFAVNLLLNLGDRLRHQNRTISAQIKQREEASERAARYDPLTGARNRHWLDEALPRWIERHRTNDSPLSVALVDLDHFKLYNDRFGHRVGDEVLASAAGAMLQVLRQTDRVARYGGDEFLVLLPETDLAQAGATAERLRESIANARPKRADPVEIPPLTASVGVAQLEPDQGVPALLDAADEALYAAKAAGRNRVRFAKERKT